MTVTACVILGFRSAYNIVLMKRGQQLYDGVRRHLSEVLDACVDRMSAVTESNFLHSLENEWKEHRLSVMMIRDILMYMVCLW